MPSATSSRSSGWIGAEQRLAEVVARPATMPRNSKLVRLPTRGQPSAIGEPEHHRRLVDQTTGLGLAGARVGEVEDLRQQVVGLTGRAVDRGDHRAHPVRLVVGSGAAEVALEVVALPSHRSWRLARTSAASAGSTNDSKRWPDDLGHRQVDQVAEHGVGLDQLAVERPDPHGDRRGVEDRGQRGEVAREGGREPRRPWLALRSRAALRASQPARPDLPSRQLRDALQTRRVRLPGPLLPGGRLVLDRDACLFDLTRTQNHALWRAEPSGSIAT